MLEDYFSCLIFLKKFYPEFSGSSFYVNLFPNNEMVGCLNADFSCPNAIFLYGSYLNGVRKVSRRIMLSDSWLTDYSDYVHFCSFALCSGLAYRGRANQLAKAQHMNALIFDLDGVGLNELLDLLFRFGKSPGSLRGLPLPTFLVLSGTGLHVYYFFEEPIDLFPDIKLQLKRLKYDLTFRLWEYEATSKISSIQYQSINQGFRMVGSVNSKYGVQLRAFKIGDKVSLDYLNSYVKKENRVCRNRLFKPSVMSREQAKINFPDWYDRVIVKGDKARKKWDISGKVHGNDPYALYHWWLKRISEVKGGYRYFFMMCLAIYAYKCDVSKSQLKKDLHNVFLALQMVQHTNQLTYDDVNSALEAYDKAYYNFTIADIEKLTDIRIERNKRNGRRQDQHLKMARAVRDSLHVNWRQGNGRPTSENLVFSWRLEHPTSSKADCRRDTNLDPKTIRKWWDCLDRKK